MDLSGLELGVGVPGMGLGKRCDATGCDRMGQECDETRCDKAVGRLPFVFYLHPAVEVRSYLSRSEWTNTAMSRKYSGSLR